MPTPNIRWRWLLGGALALTVSGLMVVAGAGGVWLGPGPRLPAQVEALLQPASPALEFGGAAHWQPLNPVKSWQIVRVQTANAHSLWESLLDDDPVYTLQVDLEVEYSNGQHAHLLWTTWRYGLALGPVVISYGDGPAGELSRVTALNLP